MFSDLKKSNPFAGLGNQQNTSNITYEIPDPKTLIDNNFDEETGKPIIGLSFSSMNQLDYCARKYQFRKRFYQPDYSGFNEFLPAASGTAIHEYIQSRLRGESPEEATFKFFMSYSFLSENEASDINLRHRSMEPSYHTACTVYDELDITSDNLVHFNIDDKILPSTEFKFCIRVDHENLNHVYLFRGAIDAIKLEGNDQIASDIKTNRNPSEDLTPEYKFSKQLVPYGLVLQHLLGKSIEEFKVRYYSIYIDALEPRLQTYTFKKTKTDIALWVRDLMLQIQRIEIFANSSIWPRASNGCVIYNRPCKHLDYCDKLDHMKIQSTLLHDGKYKPVAPTTLTPDVTINLHAEDIINVK